MSGGDHALDLGRDSKRGRRESNPHDQLGRLWPALAWTAAAQVGACSPVTVSTPKHRSWRPGMRECGIIRTGFNVEIFSQLEMCEYPHATSRVVIMTGKIEVRKPRDIGDAIRAVREARGISQEDLAQANAYDRFYLNGLEAGRSTLYITRLLRTLKSLGITLSVTFDPDEPADGQCRSDG
jgi:hypothetical protein